jgi:hypothetical protein
VEKNLIYFKFILLKIKKEKKNQKRSVNDQIRRFQFRRQVVRQVLVPLIHHHHHLHVQIKNL